MMTDNSAESQSAPDSLSAIDRKDFEVIVVGAGFAGIGAAIKLREAGFDFVILEKAAEIGGVWRDNSYPDCACDIPSTLYSFSFAPNPHWSSLFAGQAEIRDYTISTANRFGVADRIRVNHELLLASWNKAQKVWELKTNAGNYRARFVIMACGPMHKPVTPAIKGIETFTGSRFHSAQWDHSCDLEGKRIAVIGSGASAIQFLPAIESQVKQLTLFQRTPPWVLPKLDAPVSKRWQGIFERFPIVQSLFRKLLYLQFEFLNRSLKHPRLIKRLEGVALRNMYRSVKDKALRKRLTPSYAIGCKRILQSNNWYRALAKPHVAVVDSVSEVQGSTVIATDGSRCEADVLIFATGFEVANPPIAERIIGKKGITLAEQWRGSPEVYLGTVAEDCPNCFLTFGPNLYTFTSAFVIIEAQLKYIMSGLKKLRTGNITSFSVDTRKCGPYNKTLQQALQKTVWNSGGCVSYFIDKNGRNSTNWPWTTFYMRSRLRKFQQKDYILEQ
jgi:cation diffusion facilitator CzcD-associated flavoprotein CzcO